MAVFTESFTSGDGVELQEAASTCDLTWSHVQGSDPWATFGNQASPRGNLRGFVTFARAEHDTDSSDMYAQLVVAAIGAGDQGGPCVRFSPIVSTFYTVEVFGSGDLFLQKLVTGGRSTISTTMVDVTGLPKLLRLEVEGSTLTVLWDGVQVLQDTDTEITTGTRAGLAAFEDAAPGIFVDDFEFGDLGGAPAVIQLTANFAGAATVTAAPQPVVTLTADLAATAVLDTTATPVVRLTVDLTGTATVTANLGSAVQLTATLVGSATVEAAPTTVVTLTVALLGEATLTAAIGEPIGLIVGAVTGPSRRVQIITGPALTRAVTGPALRREVTGPAMRVEDITGPARVDDPTPDGPAVSREVTGPAVSRTVTGPEV